MRFCNAKCVLPPWQSSNTVGLIVGTAIAIGGAKAGYGYWALVAMTVTVPLINTIGFWLTTAWVPGMPHRRDWNPFYDAFRWHCHSEWSRLVCRQ